MKLILDIEVSIQYEAGNTNPSPYTTGNNLISVGYQVVNSEEKGYLFFHPNYATNEEIYNNKKKLQSLLDQSNIIIGHNLKFDMSWLYEVGFKYRGDLYDTMIFEYVACKGQKYPVSLKFTAKRYGLAEKKDILEEWIKEKKPLEDMPKEMWLEYGTQDIESTYQIYQHQRKRYEFEQDVRTMWPAMRLTNEALEVLIDIERAGIKIDLEALNSVELQYKQEKQELEKKMQDTVRSVMGDTPINFSSPEHMSWVVYSRKVNDKKQWAEIFNLGTEMRGSVRKIKYPTYYSPNELVRLVRDNSTQVNRTDVQHCIDCDGKGHFFKKKKDGDQFKRATTCPACKGAKVVYIDNGKIAGFKVKPPSSTLATISGFSTDKETINQLVANSDTPDEAKIFLSSLQRLNAIETYLTSFIEGIRKGIKADGYCHPNFNQCVTATGRLSSSNPNWQNQPRGHTFPVRRTVISRFGSGKLLDIDFAQLEYRTAVMLARCEAGLISIVAGKDRHQLTAEVMSGRKKEEFTKEEWQVIRDSFKPDTFAPLYGSTGKDDKRRAYKDAFYAEHTGINKWHDELVKEALSQGQVTTPSGRIFAFPNVRRVDGNRVIGRTQVLNYPVQSFATADIAWCVIVDLWRSIKKHNLRSKIILQVHDSITIDAHPEEVEQLRLLIKESFEKAVYLLEERFNYKSIVPIGYDVSIGDNLMEKKKLFSGESKFV